MSEKEFVSKRGEGEVVPTSFGELNWKITGAEFPDAEMTFGTCLIKPGERNALHSHPTCEEILYVVSGACDHKLGDAVYRLEAGDAIRIPRNIRHWAKCVGDEPLFAVIIFSSANRTAVNHEEQGAA